MMFLSSFAALIVPIVLAVKGKADRGAYFALMVLFVVLEFYFGAMNAPTADTPYLNSSGQAFPADVQAQVFDIYVGLTSASVFPAIGCLLGGILYRAPKAMPQPATEPESTAERGQRVTCT